MRGEQGRRDVHLASERARDAQAFELRFEVEPIARLDLHGGDAIAREPVEPRRRLPAQLLLRGRARVAHGAQDPAARARDLLVGRAAQPRLEFRRTISRIHEVGVAIDEARRHHRAVRVDDEELAAGIAQLVHAADPRDAAAAHVHRAALDDRIAPRPHGREASVHYKDIAHGRYHIQKSPRAMSLLFASDALLASGWARDVLLEWDEGGRLTRVEPGAPASEPRASGPVLPGMANVHSHAFQRAMAGVAETRGHPTDDFWTWREAMYALVRLVEPEDVEAIAAYLYVEMLKHGYTAVGEFHYLHRDRSGEPYANPAELAERIVNAAEAAGISLTVLPVLYMYGGLGGRPLDAAQRRFASTPDSIIALVESLRRAHPDLSLGIAPHSVRALDAASLMEVVGRARKLDASIPVHMHVSEQPREVSDCVAAHGMKPFEWIRRHVQVDGHWCLIHGTHLTPAELDDAARDGAAVGVCPTTEANLGDGIVDLPAWLGRGGEIAIGGDSHVSVSPFEELRALETSQRLRIGRRNVAASETQPDIAANLWQRAARGGARALGQPMGALAPGQRADFVVLDGADPDFESLDAARTLGVATFGASANRVRDVFVNGRCVVREGCHARDAEVASAFRAALHRLRRAS
jgi:formimidoylglutamate deiminase